MKILVVCQYYYPEPFRISDICEALVQEGHSVAVITGTPNYPEGKIYPGYENGSKADEVINGVVVHRCPIIPRKTGTLYRILNYYSFVCSSWKYLRKEITDYDVVFLNQLSPVMMAEAALMWAKKRHKRCVLYCLDLWPESLLVGGVRRDSLIYEVYLKISRRIYRRADEILVSSKAFVDYFAETLQITDKSIRWLPQYAEDMFGELPTVEKEEGKTHFLLAGNIGTAQSVETIIDAARYLQEDKKIHIHIVGGGISLEKCKIRARGLDNVTFYGRRDLSEMPCFYAMADVMIVSLVKDPALSLYLPGKVQSYMAAGKPIVGAIDGETARIIQDAKCGLCVPAEDSRNLAQVMQQIAVDLEKLKEYGENAKRYYNDNFNKDFFISELIKILEDNSRD